MNRKPSKQQEKILNKSGKFIVNACAGSGKTLSLSKKLINLMENNNNPHTGIATLSFTNAAWKEIKRNLDKWGVEIRYPNFIGTFDRFINKYIFYQYYYLLDEFDSRPTLVGDLGMPWRRKRWNRDYQQYFDIFSFDEEHNIIKTKHKNTFFKFNENKPNKHHENLKKMKYEIFNENFVTQDDINYFSLKLLKNYEFISENIANKFPIFLIDESQDTNDMKMKIMDIILNKDTIKEFIFIEDFNQAIYEWNGAKPELFEELMKKYETIKLTENWRSSQNICNISSKLSKQKYNAVNEEVKDYTFVPKIKGYNEPKDNKSEFYNNIINEFLKLCEEHNIELTKDNIAVLCKGNTLIKTINGQNTFEYDEIFKDNTITFDLINSRFLFDQRNLNESYLKLEYIISCLALNRENLASHQMKNFKSEFGFFNMKKLCLKLINLMPPTNNITIEEWINKFQLNLKNSNIYLKEKLISKIKIKRNNLFVEDLFNFDEYSNNYTLRTIHGVKGETFDATLLILKTKTDKGSYKNMIEFFKKTGKMEEDLRNVYVAITRPRKILVIAIPEKNEKIWHELLLDEPYRTKNQTLIDDYF